MTYKQQNSKGETFYLHEKVLILSGGTPQKIYYFAEEKKPEGGLAEVPEGYEVFEDERTNLLMLRKIQ